MRLLFIVQREGHGHLTQAISLAQLLHGAGHEVICGWVNLSGFHPVPSFFIEQFSAPIKTFAGPSLVYDSRSNLLDIWATIRGFVKNWTIYQTSMRQLRDAIETEKPDIVINFCELLVGLTYGYYRPIVPMICIGHQYLAFHPNFPFPKGKWLEKMLFKGLVYLSSWGATERFGLSFDAQNDVPHHRLRVMPPLLHHEFKACDRLVKKRNDHPYILACTTHWGMLGYVVEAHRARPDVMLRHFSAYTIATEKRLNETLYIHRLNGSLYLEYLEHCQAVLTTACFESICEAIYFGKPVLMMPQPNHYEQACTAFDGKRAKAGITAKKFNLNELIDSIPRYDSEVSTRFHQWYESGHARFIEVLERIGQHITA